MDSTAFDVEKYVDVLFSNDVNTEERQEADSWIRNWQYSENVFEQCFSIISRELTFSNSDSNMMFIAIKTLQERIRYYDNDVGLTSELIELMLGCFFEIIKYYVSQCEPEESNQEQKLFISPQLQFSLMCICDIITLSQSNFSEIEEMIPDCLKMLFLALFFEETQENYYISHISKNNLIQNDLVEYGIAVLAEAPMSSEWIRCFGAIVSIIKSYEMIIPLITRLPETLYGIDTISLLQNVLSDIYSGTFIYKPFFEIILEFHIAYSQELRQIADSEPLTHPILQLLWSSFFAVDYCGLYDNIELIVAAFQEFFEVAVILEIDVQLWADLLYSALKMISSSKKETDEEMEPIKIAFFQLCSRLFTNLIETFCHYKYNPTDCIGDCDLSVLSLDAYDATICNLYTLSENLLNQFLLEEEPKTIGLLKIAGMNSEDIDHELLCQYAEFALSFSNEDTEMSEILTVCMFIDSSFKSLEECIIPFISYMIEAYPLFPQQISVSLRKISYLYPGYFFQVDTNILAILVDFLMTYQPKADLIIAILNINSILEEIDFEDTGLNQISLYCVEFSKAAQESLHYLKNFVKFISYIAKYSNYGNLSFFYNQLSLSLIESLEDVLRNLNNEVQFIVSNFFKNLITSKWLTEYSIASDFIQQAIENGITQTFHINNIVRLIPLEFVPLDVFELCNNAFAPLDTVTSNVNMNVNVCDYMYVKGVINSKDAVEGVINAIANLIFYVVDNKSFEHLNLFNPQLFTNIILRTKNDAVCDNVYRTINKTINLSSIGEVPPDILVCILRGCTLKAFRCERHEQKFLIDPMIKLSQLFLKEEYVELFFDAIPAAVSDGSISDDNPAMNYLNVIYNRSSSPLENSEAIVNFVNYITRIMTVDDLFN